MILAPDSLQYIDSARAGPAGSELISVSLTTAATETSKGKEGDHIGATGYAYT